MMLIISIHPMCLLVNYVETPFRLLMKKYLLLLKLLLFLLQDLYSRGINCTQLEEGPYTFSSIINSISIALHLEHHTHSIVKTTSQKMPTNKKKRRRKKG